jgi:hypothetical protein
MGPRLCPATAAGAIHFCVRLQSLLELVANEMSAGACKDNEALQTFYNNTMGHIRQQKGKGGEAAAKYEGLQV